MRIALPRQTEYFGGVRIHGMQEVHELDSGSCITDDELNFAHQKICHIPHNDINEIQKRTAIIIPCKDENPEIIKGVISGIPHDCLAILISNSKRNNPDAFKIEHEILSDFCRLLQRNALIVHQQDPGLGIAFSEAGIPELVGEGGIVRNGKGEGMLVGITLAWLADRDFLGFVDADNYVPGTIDEYVKGYAAGFHISKSPHTLVRIHWRSKPNIDHNRIFFKQWGRASQITNQFLNLLLSERSNFGTNIITTGNSGEHAISTPLALRMRFAGGFAVEPYEYMNLFELFGGLSPSPYPDVMSQGIEIFQIKTLNPHFHTKRDNNHIQQMRGQALDMLYHSSICPDSVKEEIVKFLNEEGLLEGEMPPRQTRIYPALTGLDREIFLRVLADKSESFEQIERVASQAIAVDTQTVIPTY